MTRRERRVAACAAGRVAACLVPASAKASRDLGRAVPPSSCGIRAIALRRAFRYVRGTGFARDILMADDTPTGPVEMGAEMDYAEHDKTYHRFLMLAKFGSLVCGGAAGRDGVRLLHDGRLLLGHRSLHPHLRGRLFPAALVRRSRSSHRVGRGRRDGGRRTVPADKGSKRWDRQFSFRRKSTRTSRAWRPRPTR